MQRTILLRHGRTHTPPTCPLPTPLPTLTKFGGFGGRVFRVYFFTLPKLGNVKPVVSLA